MYTRKVRGITSTLALNIVFLDTVTLIYTPYKFISCIMHVHVVLFGSCILCIYIYIFIFVWGFPAGFGWTGSCIYHMELGPGAGLPRAEISREKLRIPKKRRRTHEQ